MQQVESDESTQRAERARRAELVKGCNTVLAELAGEPRKTESHLHAMQSADWHVPLGTANLA
jgi:hypothetical protein